MPDKDRHHPFSHGGTSQPERTAPALRPGYVSVDEKCYGAWIDFARRFAGYLSYVDVTGAHAGSWEPFFSKDTAAVLGTLAIQDIKQYQAAVAARFALLRNQDNQGNTSLLKGTLGAVFSDLATLAGALDAYVMRLPDGLPLKDWTGSLIQVQLAPQLERLMAYYKAAGPQPTGPVLIEETGDPSWIILNTPVGKASAILVSGGLSALWLRGGATRWSDYWTTISPDGSIYGDQVNWSLFRQISHAANHNLFSGIFDTFLKAYTAIIGRAESQLVRTLVDDNSHTPHYALYLAFLRIFKKAQNEINKLGSAHLDFYYQRVLRLAPKAAVPADAYVVLQLAPKAAPYLMKRGTSFKAGKDSAGQDVIFSLTEDTLFNQAVIAAKMSLYRGQAADNTGGLQNDGRLFASPVSDSRDGKGAPLTPPESAWHPFFNRVYAQGQVAALEMPGAGVGFAIASHVLLAAEGDRVIRIGLGPADLAPLVTGDTLECFITTEKGLLALPAPEVFVEKGSFTVLSFTLPGNYPAITAYDPAVHGGDYPSDTPLVTLRLSQDNALYPYNQFAGFRLEELLVGMDVGQSSPGATGIRQLEVTGEQGPVDPSRPFLPFGPRPAPGASMIIGSREAFTKKANQVTVTIQWAELPTSDLSYGGSNPTLSVSMLENGEWVDAYTTIDFNSDRVSFSVQLDDAAVADYHAAYPPYGNAAKNGFLKLTLEGDFGYKAYEDARLTYLIGLAAGNPPAKPVEPYTPKIASVTLAYSADSELHFDEAGVSASAPQFYHLLPFGWHQWSPLAGTGAVFLLPQFTFSAPAGPQPVAAAFYLGLDKLSPGQGVRLLFQVQEGSSDPMVLKPEKHVGWSYLTDEGWTTFDEQAVTDGTAGLIRSGIVSVEIPLDAATRSSRMPGDDRIWIRASVSEYPEAVCSLLGVYAQAARLTFTDQGNAPDFLATPLKAGTISKLKNPVAAVKSVTQPYEAFGGKPLESSDHFHLRVSERLRHRDRAITLWDYERLVLEAFPGIQRAKCVTHTRYEAGHYDELTPGHVTVVTIADQHQRVVRDPLRPYTDTGVLAQIKHFLSSRIPCHVKLHVGNPRFEELRLEFRVKLMPGKAFSFYSKQLGEAITAFLCPWAFDSSDEVIFGGKVEKSTLINFIEQQPYVDYLTDVVMRQRGEDGAWGSDTEEAVATTAISVLVSVPASGHLITEIPAVTAAEATAICKDPYNTAQQHPRKPTIR